MPHSYHGHRRVLAVESRRGEASVLRLAHIVAWQRSPFGHYLRFYVRGFFFQVFGDFRHRRELEEVAVVTVVHGRVGRHGRVVLEGFRGEEG